MPQAAEIATGARSREGSGYPSSTRWKRGTSRKIESTAANDSWKPGSSAFEGFQARSTIAATSSEYQRSRSRPLSHAMDASDPATPARITDGCGPTASTYAAIAASTASSALSREIPTSQANAEHPRRHEHDVRPAHGQQVVEAGGAEPLLQRVREALVLTEHDALDHAAALPTEARRTVAREPGVQAVGDTAEPRAAADSAPGIGVQHDVHAVPMQPCPLVEAVRRPARRTQHTEHRQACALRRDAAGRQLEQHRLVRALDAPADDERADARLESPDARRLLELYDGALRRADGRPEGAAVE